MVTYAFLGQSFKFRLYTRAIASENCCSFIRYPYNFNGGAVNHALGPFSAASWIVYKIPYRRARAWPGVRCTRRGLTKKIYAF